MQVDIDKAQERMLELFALSPELEEQFYAGDEAFCSKIESYCLEDSNAISLDAIQHLISTQGTTWTKIDNPDTDIDIMPLIEVYTSDLGSSCPIDIKQDVEQDLSYDNYYLAEQATARFLDANLDMPIRLNSFTGSLRAYLNSYLQCADADLADLADNNILLIQNIIDLDNQMYAIAQQHIYLTRIGEYRDSKIQAEIPELNHQEYDIFDNPEPVKSIDLLNQDTYHVPAGLDDNTNIATGEQGILADLDIDEPIPAVGLFDLLTTTTSEDFDTDEDDIDELDELEDEPDEEEEIFDDPDDIFDESEDVEEELTDDEELVEESEDELTEEFEDSEEELFDDPDDAAIFDDVGTDNSDEDFETELAESEELVEDEDELDEDELDEDEEVFDDPDEEDLESIVDDYNANLPTNIEFDIFADDFDENIANISTSDIQAILEQEGIDEDSEEVLGDLEEEEIDSEEVFEDSDEEETFEDEEFEDSDEEFEDSEDEETFEDEEFEDSEDEETFEDETFEDEDEEFENLDEEETFEELEDLDEDEEEILEDEEFEDQDEEPSDLDEEETVEDEVINPTEGTPQALEPSTVFSDETFDDEDEVFTAADFEDEDEDELSDIPDDDFDDLAFEEEDTEDEEELQDEFDEIPDEEEEVSDEFDELPDEEEELQDEEEELQDEEEELQDEEEELQDEEEELQEEFDELPDEEESFEGDFDEILDEEESSDDDFDEIPDDVFDESDDIMDFLDDDEEIDDSIFEAEEDDILSLDCMLNEDIETAHQATEQASQYNPLSSTDMGIPQSAIRAPQTAEEKNVATADAILSLYNKLARSPKIAMSALRSIFQQDG